MNTIVTSLDRGVHWVPMNSSKTCVVQLIIMQNVFMFATFFSVVRLKIWIGTFGPSPPLHSFGTKDSSDHPKYNLREVFCC